MSAQHTEQEARLSEVVAANIRAEVARRGWRQQDFAQRMGMGRVAVSERGNGRTPWTLDEMQKAASVLRMPLSDLLLPRLDSNQQPFVYASAHARARAVWGLEDEEDAA